ncbi:hypothetical protein HK104_003377, partial [Borealophlyctis nickersoniae]
RMGYSAEEIARIRREEAQMGDFVDYVNAIDGFVSQCSLGEIEQGYKPATEESQAKWTSLRKGVINAAKQILGSFKDPIIRGVATFLESAGIVDYGRGQEAGEKVFGQLSAWVDAQAQGNGYSYNGQGYQQQQPGYQQQQPGYQQPTYQQPTSYQQPPTYSQPQPQGGYQAGQPPSRPAYGRS